MTQLVLGRVSKYAGVVLLGLMTQAPVGRGQTASATDAMCSLLPDLGARPKTTTARPANWNWPVCYGQYFPIPVPNQPDQYGLTVTISKLDTPAQAKSALQLPGGKAVTYGDGGFEIPGDPTANDQTLVSRTGRSMVSIEELTGQRPSPKYTAVFTRGNTYVSVQAFPSKITTARKVVAELDAALLLEGGNAAGVGGGGGGEPEAFQIGASACGDDGAGMKCVVSLLGSGTTREVDYTWSVDGRIQAGVVSRELTVKSIAKGKHTIKVRAVDKNTKQPSNVLEIEFIK